MKYRTVVSAFRVAAVAAFTAMSAACSAGSDTGVVGFSIRDSAGIRIAQNDAAITSNAPMLRLDEDLRIGAVSGLPEEEFGGLLDVEVGQDGEIYAVDALVRTVRVFGADGQFLRSIGEPGDGPGGFSFEPLGIALGIDTVVVHDRLNFYVFRADGTHVHTGRQRVSGNGFLPVFARSADTWLAGRVVVSPARSDRERTTRDTFRIWGFDPLDGTRGDPIIEVESTPRRYFPDMARSREQWLGARAAAAVRANGEIYVVAGDAYEVAIHASDGQVVRRIRADPERIPLSEATMEDALALEIERASSPEMAFGIEQARELGPPVFKPVAGQLLVARDGSVLLERRDLGPNDAWPSATEQTTWDLIDPNGRIAGRLAFKAGAWVQAFTGSHVFVVERDDLDVPYIVRYRIVREIQ